MKMKKKIISLGLCCLLLLVPSITAFPVHHTITKASTLNPPHQTDKMDPPPTWAHGNFSGVWGLTILGVPVGPSGWITGYYENIGLGQFDAVYGTFNETNASSFLRGFMLWIFFLGFAGNLQTGNGTWVMGLGVANETSYYCRINTIIGPSFYILANYYPFEKER